MTTIVVNGERHELSPAGSGTLLAVGYRVPRFSDKPDIRVLLVDRPDVPSAGAGETPLIADRLQFTR